MLFRFGSSGMRLSAGILSVLPLVLLGSCGGGSSPTAQTPESSISALSDEADPSSTPDFVSFAPGDPGLLISEFLANPAGTDSPFEYVELIATQTIDFSITPYSVVFSNNGTATANGWIAGGSVTYGFSITSGTVNAGDVVYVGGSSMAPTGTKLRTINTGTTAGDQFGTANSSGVLGNGGSNADGIAVFASPIASLTASTVPDDAIFFGTATGTAVVNAGADGYQLPTNDNYSGGKLQSASFLAADPASGSAIIATGTYNTDTNSFSANRTWATGTATDSSSAITLQSGPPDEPPTLTGLPESFSAVLGDPSFPVGGYVFNFTVGDDTTAPGDLDVTVESSDPTVLPNSALTLVETPTDSGNWQLRITSPGLTVGFTTITVEVAGGGGATQEIEYGVSQDLSGGKARYHVGACDASSAIALDANFMLVADDEDQVIRLYNRNQSNLPVNFLDLPSFDFTTSLTVGDEVDIEASTRLGNRIFWLGSHSNSSSGNLRPDRARLFATDLTGTGTSTTLSYVGRYDNLRADLINWDSNNLHGKGANFYGLAASAAQGVQPEDPTGAGFSIEGFTVAPNGVDALIGFRAPIVPPTNRSNALVVPIQGFANLVNGNPAAGPALLGAPIEMNLNGRGIRSMECTSKDCTILAGPVATGQGDFKLFSWNGKVPKNGGLAQVKQLRTDLTGLNPEGFMVGSAKNTLQLISDNGDDDWYEGLATENECKDLPESGFKKFRSDVVSSK